MVLPKTSTTTKKKEIKGCDIKRNKRKDSFNFTKSDGRTMSFAQKGQIFALYDEGKPIKKISGITGFSMDWIQNLIGALQGTKARTDAITEWREHEKLESRVGNDNANGKRTSTGKARGKATRKVKRKPRNKTLKDRNTKSVLQSTRKTLSRTGIPKHGDGDNARRGTSNSGSDAGKGIVGSLRRHKDYRGEE